MIAVWIVTGILLLLLALLLAPVSARAAYVNGELRLSVHYLFLRFVVWPAPEEETTTKKSKAEQPPEPEKPLKEKKKPKIGPKDIWELVKSSRRGLRTLCRNLIFYDIVICAAVGGPDAHRAAVTYGRLHAALSCGLAALGSLFVLKKPIVRLVPMFYREQTVWEARLRVRILPWHVLVAAVQVLVPFLKVTSKAKKDNKNKGGIRHESAVSHQ